MEPPDDGNNVFKFCLKIPVLVTGNRAEKRVNCALWIKAMKIGTGVVLLKLMIFRALTTISENTYKV